MTLSCSMSSASLAWMSTARPLSERLRASLEEEYIMRGCAILSVRCAFSWTLIPLCSKCDTHVLSGIIGHPADEGDLVALALAAGSVVLDVVDGITATNALDTLAVLALGAEELLAEGLVVVLGRSLFDNDLLPVIGDLEDDPLGALAELEVVEGLDALGSDGDTEWRMSVALGLWSGSYLAV